MAKMDDILASPGDPGRDNLDYFMGNIKFLQKISGTIEKGILVKILDKNVFETLITQLDFFISLNGDTVLTENIKEFEFFCVIIDRTLSYLETLGFDEQKLDILKQMYERYKERREKLIEQYGIEQYKEYILH